MNEYRRTIRALALAAAVMVAGCNSGSKSGEADASAAGAAGAAPKHPEPATPIGLVPASRPPIADLPIPMGFKLVESLSRSYISAVGRHVDHTYEGKADKFDVERFYRQQMPLKNWTLRSSALVRGTMTITYEKDKEECIVTITGEERALRGTYSAVTLDIHPVGRGEPIR